MKRHSTTESTHNPDPQMHGEPLPAAALGELPNRLLLAFESHSSSAATRRPYAARTCADF